MAIKVPPRGNEYITFKDDCTTRRCGESNQYFPNLRDGRNKSPEIEAAFECLMKCKGRIDRGSGIKGINRFALTPQCSVDSIELAIPNKDGTPQEIKVNFFREGDKRRAQIIPSDDQTHPTQTYLEIYCEKEDLLDQLDDSIANFLDPSRKMV